MRNVSRGYATFRNPIGDCMFTFRRQRADESAATYEQRHAAAVEAYEQRERELDEHDAQAAEAWSITDAANALALRMAIGTATLADLQEFLAADHGNAYADLGSLTLRCAALGLDPGTGRLGLAPRLFLDALRAGLPSQDALARAMALPDAVALWSQDPNFRRELAEIRYG